MHSTAQHSTTHAHLWCIVSSAVAAWRQSASDSDCLHDILSGQGTHSYGQGAQRQWGYISSLLAMQSIERAWGLPVQSPWGCCCLHPRTWSNHIIGKSYSTAALSGLVLLYRRMSRNRQLL